LSPVGLPENLFSVNFESGLTSVSDAEFEEFEEEEDESEKARELRVSNLS